MDVTSLIEIVVAIVIVYFLIKFIVSPIIKALVGVVAFLILIYLLQHYLGFDFGKILSPFGISFDTSRWDVNFGWLLNPLNYYINQAISLFNSAMQNVPKSH